MNLNHYISFIILVKVLFIFFSLTHLYYKIIDDEENKINVVAVYWRGRLEFIFTIAMAALLIYLFNPYYNHDNLITHETKLLLYLFGFILIIVAEWGLFIRENKLVKYLQLILGK
jgi:hypothetical protein